MVNVVYNFDKKVFLQEDGSWFVSGCENCGYPKKYHAWMYNCGKYVAPSDQTVLSRMKENRLIRLSK